MGRGTGGDIVEYLRRHFALVHHLQGALTVFLFSLVECQVIMEKEFTTIATNSVVNVTVITNTIKKGVSCSVLASLHCNSG